MLTPYAPGAPNPQQTLDIFQGQWASKLPAPLDYLTAGEARLFEDPRVGWCIDKLSELGIIFSGSDVLELGPLEGGHTYLLSRAGANSVTAIEAHSGAYLKCLITKELLGIEKAAFLYGDAVKFLREDSRRFDVGFACGFLYHMSSPVELLALLAEKCRSLYIWTVCWDEQFVKTSGPNAGGQGPAHRAVYKGFEHTLHRHDYGTSIKYSNFWGGPASHSYWMEYDEIIGALHYFGFKKIIHEPDSTPYGKAIKLLVSK